GTRPFAPLGQRMAFIGRRAGEPEAMWITDGTGPGTVKVRDAPAAEYGLPEYLLPWVTARGSLVPERPGRARGLPLAGQEHAVGERRQPCRHRGPGGHRGRGRGEHARVDAARLRRPRLL